MFIEKDGEIKVTLYIRKFSNGSIRVEQHLEDIPEKDREKFNPATFTMRPLTWKQHNEVQRASTVNRGPGMGSDLDWVLYKERKLCTVLVGWDAKDKNDKPVPVTEERIFNLCPQIAETLLQEFDRATIMGDEERKN
jgi:hypothetical protein